MEHLVAVRANWPQIFNRIDLHGLVPNAFRDFR